MQTKQSCKAYFFVMESSRSTAAVRIDRIRRYPVGTRFFTSHEPRLSLHTCAEESRYWHNLTERLSALEERRNERGL